MVNCDYCRKEFERHVFCSPSCKVMFNRTGGPQKIKTADDLEKFQNNFNPPIKVFKIGCPKHGKKECILCDFKKKTDIV